MSNDKLNGSYETNISKTSGDDSSLSNFKTACGLFVGASLLTFGAWLMSRALMWQWPWFIYPIGAMLMGLSFHYYYYVLDRKLLSLHFSWAIIANTLILFSWIFQMNYSAPTSTWFIYPLAISSLLYAAHYCGVHYKHSREIFLNFHMMAFGIMSTLFFACYMDLRAYYSYPWFIYPVFLFAGFLAIHASYHYYPRSLLVLHISVFTIAQTFMFFVWSVNGMGFPWFTFPLIGWSALLGVHTLVDLHYSSSTPSVPKDIMLPETVHITIDSQTPVSTSQEPEAQFGSLDEEPQVVQQPVQVEVIPVRSYSVGDIDAIKNVPDLKMPPMTSITSMAPSPTVVRGN